MKALKTIIATAVIVFALTTVAMAGVQHFTKAQDAQAAGRAQVNYTVTLSAKQLAQLIGAQSAGKASATRPAHRATHSASHKARAQRAHYAQDNGQSGASHHSSSHHSEPKHRVGTFGNGHAGDCADGGSQCGDGGGHGGD